MLQFMRCVSAFAGHGDPDRGLRRYAKVDNEYLPHFLEVKGGYPTLVVVGPSGGGKTE